MNTEVADLSLRHKRYDNIDGTGEIAMGLMLLAFALLGELQPRLPAHSFWRTNGLASLLLMYLVLFPMLGLGWLIQRWVKMHITWPRTGYVALLRDAKDLPAGCEVAAPRFSRRARLAAVALASGLLAALIAIAAVFAQSPAAAALARILYVLLMAGTYGFWVYFMGGRRVWKWMLFLLLALGLVAINIADPGRFSDIARGPTLWCVAGAWIVSGALTLAGYIRRTPPPVEAPQ